MDKHEHRRLRLIELRDWECEGMVARLAERIARSDSYVARMLYPEGKAGKKRIGDDMIDVLESSFGLTRGWLDMPLGTPVTAGSQQPLGLETPPPRPTSAPVSISEHRSKLAWPFPSVSPQRLADLKRALGPRHGAEAMRDLDALLDVAVTKWERRGNTAKRRSG